MFYPYVTVFTAQAHESDGKHREDKATFRGAFGLGQPGLEMLLRRMQTLNWDTTGTCAQLQQVHCDKSLSKLSYVQDTHLPNDNMEEKTIQSQHVFIFHRQTRQFQHHSHRLQAVELNTSDCNRLNHGHHFNFILIGYSGKIKKELERGGAPHKIWPFKSIK